jgi:hypothetical protein
MTPHARKCRGFEAKFKIALVHELRAERELFRENISRVKNRVTLSLNAVYQIYNML